MKKIKIFLASSIELENEIILFGNEVGKKNDAVTEKDVYFELKTWREYIYRIVKEGLQQESNDSEKKNDIFLLLAHTKLVKFNNLGIRAKIFKRVERCPKEIIEAIRVIGKDNSDFNAQILAVQACCPNNQP